MAPSPRLPARQRPGANQPVLLAQVGGRGIGTHLASRAKIDIFFKYRNCILKIPQVGDFNVRKLISFRWMMVCSLAVFEVSWGN